MVKREMAIFKETLIFAFRYAAVKIGKIILIIKTFPTLTSV